MTAEYHAPLRATLKAGTGFDSPWITVDGASPEELTARLAALQQFGTLEAVVSAANLLKAVNNVATIAQDVASPPPVQQAAPQQASGPALVQTQPGGWNTSPSEVVPTWAAQSAQPQQAPAAPQQQGIRLHPEGIKCPVDGNVVQFKKTPPRKSDGKSFEFWTCPNQRSRDDGHYSQFAN